MVPTHLRHQVKGKPPAGAAVSGAHADPLRIPLDDEGGTDDAGAGSFGSGAASARAGTSSVPAPPGVGLLLRPPAQGGVKPAAHASAAAAGPVSVADRVLAGRANLEETKWLKSKGIKSASEDYEAFMRDVTSLTW